MSGPRTDSRGITVTTERNAVVVTIPEGATLEEDEAKDVNEKYMDQVRKDHVDAALTVMETDDPLSGRVFEQVKQAAAAGHDQGVTRWAIVVDERVKGMAFSSQIDGIETQLFEEKRAALNWLDQA